MDAYLDEVGSRPVALLLEGDIGIGKTTLWKEGVARARERSYRVLACSPAEVEARLPYAALGDVLEGVPDEVLARLPEPQRRAIDAALLRSERTGRPLLRAISLGVLETLRMVAEEGPVIVAMDDVQWLDPPSVRILAFAIRRLAGEPVGVLAARRAEAPAAVPLDLEGLVPEDRFRLLRVAPLDVDSLALLLRRRLGAQLLRPTLVHLHRASGGNPFFALEIARTIGQPGFHLEPGEPLPLPSSLSQLVRERLGELSPGARTAALLASATSQPTRALLRTVLGPRRATAGLAAGVEAGVIEWVDDDRIGFTHPLLGSVLYAEAAPEERRRLHARLASALGESDEGPRHLALATEKPDAAVASALDDAARRARTRGAPDAAAELAEQARKLTPPDRAEEIRRRKMTAAAYQLEAGETKRAEALLGEAVAVSAPGPARAEALLRLGWVRGYKDSFSAADLFHQARREAGEDRALRAEIEDVLAWTCHARADLPAALAHAQTALELAEKLGDQAVLARTLGNLAFLEFLLGHGVRTSLMERARALEKASHEVRIIGRPTWLLSMLLLWTGDLDAARSTLDELYEQAVEHGDEYALPYILNYFSRLDLLAGDWLRASSHADEAYNATLQSGQDPERAFALSTRALIDAHLGRVDSARATTEQGLALAERAGVKSAAFEFLATLGFLELSLGNPAGATQHLAVLAAELAAARFREPSVLRFHSNAVEALISLGRVGEADALARELEERAGALGSAWALATTARCRALLHGAEGDLAEALVVLAEALGYHERLPEPFELGRTLLVKGTIERRRKKKRDARASLEQAAGIFDRLGAPLWSAKARAELERIGGRPSAPRTLTPTEDRVAALVAEGHSNQEIADALFVSVKTVEWNLSKIYRKLGLHSRGELAASVAAGRRSSPGA